MAAESNDEKGTAWEGAKRGAAAWAEVAWEGMQGRVESSLKASKLSDVNHKRTRRKNGLATEGVIRIR